MPLIISVCVSAQMVKSINTGRTIIATMMAAAIGDLSNFAKLSTFFSRVYEDRCHVLWCLWKCIYS